MVLVAQVYFVLLETVLLRSRGAKVFGISKDQVEPRAAAMSNQGCYNGFLVGATVSKKIFFIQSVPAVVALGTFFLAR